MAEERLDVADGESYAVPDGERHEYFGATVNGSLDLSSGSISLIDDPEQDSYLGSGSSSVVDQPGEAPISLPLEINLSDMQLGNAVFLTLTLGLLGGLVAFLRNYAAGILLSVAIVILIISGLLGLGLEMFWAAVVSTVLLLIAGMAMRWLV